MPVFVEFLIVAFVIYLWESALWLPLRCVALRKRRFSKKWRTLDPQAIFSTRELGLVPSLPLPPDVGLAPCQSPPLMAAGVNEWVIERADGSHLFQRNLDWPDIKEDSHHLLISEMRVRISTHRCIGVLRRSKKRGSSLADAVRDSWRLALSPSRAGREWRRWKRVAGPLRRYGILLTLGFFVGLPAIYAFKGGFAVLLFGLWLWCLMIGTAAHLWWLGKRVYPEAKSALRMDALLALLVPFHAMRAYENAAVHAMGTTHPAALLIWAGDLENPWLAGFIRRVLHPAPESSGEASYSQTLRPLLEKALIQKGKRIEDFDGEPDRSGDDQAERYCPRCHGLYLKRMSHCADCRGLALRQFAKLGSGHSSQ